MREITQFEGQIVSGGDAVSDMPKKAIDAAAKALGAAVPYALSPVIGLDKSKAVYSLVIVPSAQYVACTLADIAFEQYNGQ